MEDQLLTTGEVARAVGVTINTVKSWIRAGRLEALRLPSGHHRIPQAEVERVLSQAREAVQLNRPRSPLATRRQAWERFASWERGQPSIPVSLDEAMAHIEAMLALARSRGPLPDTPITQTAKRVANLHRALACLS